MRVERGRSSRPGGRWRKTTTDSCGSSSSSRSGAARTASATARALAEVVLDRSEERVGAVGQERHPEPEAAERVRHLDARQTGQTGPRAARRRRSRDRRRPRRRSASSTAASRTQQAPAALGTYSHLCGSIASESARARPANSAARRRRGRGGRALGAVDVQPDAVLGADLGDRSERIDGAGVRRAGDAQTATGVTPAARSAAIARASSSGRMRNASSQRIARTALRPSPSRSQARPIEWCASSERRPRPSPAQRRARARPGSARSRAHASAAQVRDRAAARECPPPAGNPTNSAIQRQATSSTQRPRPPAAEVRVERGHEHGGGDARLEARAVDERELPRMPARVLARQHVARDALDRGLEPTPERGSGTR